MPIAAGVLAEGRTWTTFGPFRLGRWFKPLGVVGACGVAVLLYAGVQPPNDILVTYVIGIAIVMLGLWFGLERRRFKGPPVGASLAARRAPGRDRRRDARRRRACLDCPQARLTTNFTKSLQRLTSSTTRRPGRCVK